MENNLINGVLGLAIGDAFGIPVEGKTREELRANPVTDWREYGTHSQKKGTWGDNTSACMCTLESLMEQGEPDGEDVLRRLSNWKALEDYTAHEEVFRADGALCEALNRYHNGYVSSRCGVGAGTLAEGDSCAALMRMVPFAYFQELRYGNAQIRELTKEEIDAVHEFCQITNASLVTQVACGIYTAIIREALSGITPPRVAITRGLKNAFAYYDSHGEYQEALASFAMLRSMEVLMPDMAIRTGYGSAETLVAAIWCVLKTCDSDSANPYTDTIIRAVNLGGNTPGVAAIAGSLVSILYGYGSIPEEWKETVARRVWIEDMARRSMETAGDELTAMEEQLSYT